MPRKAECLVSESVEGIVFHSSCENHFRSVGS